MTDLSCRIEPQCASTNRALSRRARAASLSSRAPNKKVRQMIKNILVVGGGSTRNHMIVRELRESGHYVEEVSVRESIEILQHREKIDLVIVGVSLEENSAFSLAKMVKESGVNLFLMSDGIVRRSHYAAVDASGPGPDGGDETVDIGGPLTQNVVMGRISVA